VETGMATRSATGAAAVPGTPSHSKLGRWHRQVCARLHTDDPRWRKATIALLVASPLIYGGVSQLLGQDVNWDLRNYHYFDPYWLLVNHMRDIMPAQLQTYYSPFLDIPFYLSVNHLSPRWIAFLIAVVQGTAFPILYLIGRQFTTRRLLSLTLAALGMCTSGALAELGTILGDTLIAPLLLGAILLGIQSVASGPRLGRPPSHPLRRVFCAGGLAGVATGLKPSGLPIAAGVIVAVLLVAPGTRRRLTAFVAAAGGLAIGVIVTYGWWGYELWTRYRNPVLPYFNQFFHSAYAPNSPNAYPIPHGIPNILFGPVLWTLNPYRVNETNFVELSLVFLELLLVVLVVSAVIKAGQARSRPVFFDTDPQRFLMVTVVVSYLVWVLEFGLYRYFVPIEMLSFVAIFVCLQAMRTRIPIREFAGVATQLVIGAMVVIVLLSLITEIPGGLGRSAWTSRTFSASIPSTLTRTPSAFLMLGLNPNGYVVPLFPSDDFFAGVQGNLPPTPLLRRQIIRDAAGYRRVYILWSDRPPRHTSALELLETDSLTARHYGYGVKWKRCMTFPARVGAQDHQFHVCPLVKSTALTS
jgi:hypothetical protein